MTIGLPDASDDEAYGGQAVYYLGAPISVTMPVTDSPTKEPTVPPPPTAKPSANPSAYK